jgi:hypothetical protein
MRRIRSLSAWLALAALCAVILYGIPTLLEIALLHHVASLWEIALGDLCGCLILAISNWKKALVLYVALTTVELLLLSGRLISPEQIVWFADLVPAVLIFTALVTRIKTFATAAQIEGAQLPR